MATKNAKKTPETADGTKKKRTRLSPEIRRKQILEAALVEFSAQGFAATSIAMIARRVGISKANVYVHFSSKDEIFETLLRSLSALGRSQGNWRQIEDTHDVPGFIDNLVDVTYASFTPEALAILRLMIAEGHRIPDVLAKWNESNVNARTERQAIIDEQVAAGRMKRSPLSEHFHFAMTPFVYAGIAKLVFGDAATEEVERMKETHRKLLHQLLEP
ncbi:helix-turn-helix domain-containing protein [Xanthomonas sp. NCPPB 2654]|uniref:TetR/AcrR family transcriptional regulator n=1 Tax=unclassified Xanthomonas TaxID=2643310 RepID=UPI0021E0F553|nr:MULTISPECIES: TetR/AcrR family transcriptional regulator [unclassified Xanthomonas]MDL5366566.1 helix-turn-helix domain-containing protein [Xanthomonas sp. NCPPB 2654]UYC21294.1 TetR/AcrR family transcriptional regulator [Xanthomonas sp. CFBP 8443]